MKMRFWDRLLMRLGALLCLLSGVINIGYGIMLYGRVWSESGQVNTALLNAAPLALIISGALIFIAGLYDILLPRRYNPRRRSFVIQPTEHGELRIAVSAIENLILKCVETHKEVRVISMSIINRRGAINVDLRVSMNSNVSIPHAIDQLQTQIKRYLSASSGIEVRDIGVSVERAMGSDADLPRESLDSSPDAAPAPARGEAEGKPPKPARIPLHQRIFGRDEGASSRRGHDVEPPAYPSAQDTAAPAPAAAADAPESTPDTSEADDYAPADKADAPDCADNQADIEADEREDETAPAQEENPA